MQPATCSSARFEFSQFTQISSVPLFFVISCLLLDLDGIQFRVIVYVQFEVGLEVCVLVV